jgi:hypothetical protein
MTTWRDTIIPGPPRVVTRELQQLCELTPSLSFFQTRAPNFRDEILLFVP